uniref:Ribosomal protein L32 n=1 Tax=Deltalsia parasitica TaxID=1424640 RepID=UPI0022FD4204|nr:Ribosomal protein L32 [Deltalsia parasitica]WAX02826.1 Ribosomal protein L32 [Deltalsia parasitica]
MAVPKKRTSKSKSRKANWKKKALFTSRKSLSLAKSLINGKSTTFIYSKSFDDYKLTGVV